MSMVSSSPPGQTPAPVPPKKRGAWQVIKSAFAVIGGVVSVVGGAIGIYLALAPSPDQTVIARVVDLPLVYRSRTFPIAVTIAGVDAGNQDLLQTEVTLWRDRGGPIKAEMVRRPLRVSLPSGSRMVAFKVANVESSMPDNFTVDRDGDDLLVRWKVFDPDMALRMYLLRAGSADGVSLTDELGPGVRTTRSRYGGVNWFKGLAFIGLGIVMFLLAAVVMLVLLGLLLRGSLKWDKRIPYASVRNTIALTGIILSVGAYFLCLQYEAQVLTWLMAKSFKPIPFQ